VGEIYVGSSEIRELLALTLLSKLRGGEVSSVARKEEEGGGGKKRETPTRLESNVFSLCFVFSPSDSTTKPEISSVLVVHTHERWCSF